MRSQEQASSSEPVAVCDTCGRSDIEEILLAGHCITLCHSVARLSRRPNPIALPTPSRMVLGLICGNDGCWYTCDRFVWFYLQLRCTSRDGLIIATDWYIGQFTQFVTSSLRARAATLGRMAALRNIGCMCMTCNPSWFEAGWRCPRT